MSEHAALLEEMLAQVEGGQDVLDEMERERAWRPPETETARKIRDENIMLYLEREGTIKRGSGKLPANFWDLPRPDDPDNSVRRAIEEDRR
jgi:hypothetical protein